MVLFRPCVLLFWGGVRNCSLPHGLSEWFCFAFREKRSQAGQANGRSRKTMCNRWIFHCQMSFFPEDTNDWPGLQKPELAPSCGGWCDQGHALRTWSQDIPSNQSKSLGIGTTWNHQRVLWKLKAWCGWMPLNIFERLISFNANAISSISTRCRRASTSLHKQLGVEARIEIHRKLSVCLGKACLQNTSSSVEAYNVLEYVIISEWLLDLTWSYLSCFLKDQMKSLDFLGKLDMARWGWKPSKGEPLAFGSWMASRAFCLKNVYKCIKMWSLCQVLHVIGEDQWKFVQ